MHVLFTVHGYKPAFRIGGPAISVSAIAEHLVQRGYRVTVFTTNSNLDQDLDVPLDQRVDVNGVEVWYFRRHSPIRRYFPFFGYMSKSIGFLYAPRMYEHLEQIVPNVDLVHTHLPFVYPTYAGGRAAIRQGKPLFYHQRGVFDPERLKFRSLKKQVYLTLFELPLMRRATTLIALTEAERESYRALGLENPCAVIPNGVEVGNYLKESPERRIARWGIDQDTQVVLFLGRLHPIKGADILVKAFLKIHAKHPKSVLVMAGPDEWGMERQIKDLAGDTAKPGIVFTGMVSGEDKINLLARADLFCLPSAGEGLSIAMLEAMASGTPVLISPGCHFQEAADHRAGWVCNPDVDSLSNTLDHLLSDAGSLRAAGDAARRLVMEKYSWDRVTDKLVDTYQEGIARHRSVRG